MSDGKSFQLAFLVSVLVHSALFLGLPHAFFLPNTRPLEKLQITYYKIKKMPERKVISKKKIPAIVRKLPRIKKEEILNPPRPMTRKLKKTRPKRKRITTVSRIKEKRFEVVVEEEQDEAKKATYISYYKAVRERIKRFADSNYSRQRKLGTGEVFLSFVVASSGELLQVKVIDNKSINDMLLRNIAINSIRDASPFPSFPRGMSQYQITFNVIISFELNK